MMSPIEPSKRSGHALIYTAMMLTALVMMLSLSFDWSNVLSAKAQLQAAVDAAARNGAGSLGSGTTTARNNAIAAAGYNEIDGAPVVILPAEVITGNWNDSTRVFTANGTPLNAIRINGSRTAAKGNAIPMVLASVMGVRGIDVRATATAYVQASQSYGVISREGINMSGNSKINSYDSRQGAYPAGKGAQATVAGNFGYMNMSGNTKIEGDLFYTGNAPNGTVTGTKKKIDSLPTITNPTTPSGATNWGNFNGGNLTLNSGNHYFQNFSSSSGTITINANNGPVLMFVNGAFSVSGNTTFAYSQGMDPADLEVNMVASAGVDMSGNVNLYAIINAPNSPLNMSGNCNVMGSVLMKQISLSGTGGIHQDIALTGSGGGGGISIVD